MEQNPVRISAFFHMKYDLILGLRVYRYKYSLGNLESY